MRRKTAIFAGTLCALVLVAGGSSLWLHFDHQARERAQAVADANAAAEAERLRLAEEAERRRLYQEALARREAAWQSRLDTARALAAGLWLAGTDIACDVENQVGPLRSTGDAAADLLLTVAEQPLTVFFVHGFEATAHDGRQSVGDMRTNFADHIATARAGEGNSAFCLVRWNSQQGFGDHQLHLAGTIAAVRRLQADPLIFPVARPTTVVIGYSAGGNFAKHAIVHALANPASSVVQDGPWSKARRDALVAAENTPVLRLVALGTPHGGGDLADAATVAGEGTGRVIQFFGWLFGDTQSERNGAQFAEGMRDYRNMPGVRQLARGNVDLVQLNDRFSQYLDTVEFFNIYSRDDDIVSIASAVWSQSHDRVYAEMLHKDFKFVDPNSAWRPVWTEIYAPPPPSVQPARSPDDRVWMAEQAVIAAEGEQRR